LPHRGSNNVLPREKIIECKTDGGHVFLFLFFPAFFPAKDNKV
jgi:hypothetical protein